MKNKENQSGRAWIEMMGVLMIVGVLSVGGIVALHQAINKNKSNALLSGVAHTIANFRTTFIHKDDVEELSTDEAYELGIVPDSFKRNVDKVTHAYGGEVKIQVKTTEDGHTYYAVAINGLPRDVAMSIVTQDWRESGDLVSVLLNEDETGGGDEDEEEDDDDDEEGDDS